MAPAPASSDVTRFQNGMGAAIRKTSASPGTTRKACSILVRKANPRAVPDSATQRVLPPSVARTMQYAATTSSSTNNASGLL